MSTPGRLSTCGTCGGTIRYWTGLRSGWRHVGEDPDRVAGHRADPDDSAVSGPDRDDLDPCTGCGHPEHDEGECEKEISTGLYGSDGVEVTRYCPCLGAVPGVTVSRVAPDPWTDPDAAAAATPPPF